MRSTFGRGPHTHRTDSGRGIVDRFLIFQRGALCSGERGPDDSPSRG